MRPDEVTIDCLARAGTPGAWCPSGRFEDLDADLLGSCATVEIELREEQWAALEEVLRWVELDYETGDVKLVFPADGEAQWKLAWALHDCHWGRCHRVATPSEEEAELWW